MERSLSARSSLFGEGFKQSRYAYSDIASSIDAGRGLIDIIRVNRDAYSGTGVVNYLALLIKPGSEMPEYVVLANGSDLEGKYYSYYRNVIKQQMADDYSYEQYWSAIDRETADLNDLYVSLDGIYNQLSIPTLHDGNSFILDKKSITLLSSSRDLLDETASSSYKGDYMLIGDPDFGSDKTVAPLPGTRKEIENLGALLKSRGLKYVLVSGDEASESRLKTHEKVNTLHVATHGYFLEDPAPQGKIFGINADHASDNPLLRSGLMFSNAALTLEGGVINSLNNYDNGLLTAYEAMNLTLDGLETVVLSACETGLGDVKAGEGVYGLQRAFLVAGAKTLLMSLWTVNDEATQELMTSFYQNWTSGMSEEKALREAQIKLKAKFKHPYYWGAFVMVKR
jgi:CHAT domain-containing protein